MKFSYFFLNFCKSIALLKDILLIIFLKKNYPLRQIVKIINKINGIFQRG